MGQRGSYNLRLVAPDGSVVPYGTIGVAYQVEGKPLVFRCKYNYDNERRDIEAYGLSIHIAEYLKTHSIKGICVYRQIGATLPSAPGEKPKRQYQTHCVDLQTFYEQSSTTDAGKWGVMLNLPWSYWKAVDGLVKIPWAPDDQVEVVLLPGAQVRTLTPDEAKVAIGEMEEARRQYGRNAFFLSQAEKDALVMAMKQQFRALNPLVDMLVLSRELDKWMMGLGPCQLPAPVVKA